MSQTFCATGNSIDKIRFVAGVNDRVNKGYVKLTVKDSDDKILYEQDWETSGWLEDRIITANLNGVPTTTGEYYTAVFEVTQANAGTTKIATPPIKRVRIQPMQLTSCAGFCVSDGIFQSTICRI